MYSFLLLLGLLISTVFGNPEQVHLSLGEDETSMVVTWLTFKSTPPPIVQYGPTTDMQSKHVGHTTVFEYHGDTRYIHTATLNALTPNTVYYYKVGTANDWSQMFQFKTFPVGKDFQLRVCVFGDLAYNGKSIPDIRKAADKGWFDMIIHVGDIAYDLHGTDDDGVNIGDIYMKELEPIFARYPYMVIAGNHEKDGRNFSHYHNRFRMPGEASGHHNNQFYSYNIGPTHFFGVSTELYHSDDGTSSVFAQYNWLTDDLKEANKNRAARPWIIGYQHRPFYCSNTDCKNDNDPYIRIGENNVPGLESTYIKNKVDLIFCGHMHSYERFYPIANLVPQAGAPAYITTGNAGTHHPRTPFGSPHPGSAFTSDDYGYTMMTIHNHTHIHLYQWSVDQQKNIDPVWIIKD